MNPIIFIGSIYPDSLKEDLLSLNAHVDFAANTFQTALLRGLDNFTNVTVITSPVVTVKSRTRKRFEGYGFSHKGEDEKKDIYIGSINNFLFKFNELVKVRRYLKVQLRSAPNSSVVIYALHSPFLLAIQGLSIKKTCIVVPDLPEHMSDRCGFFFRVAKWIDRKIINVCLRKVDKYVLLSPFMKQKLPIGKKEWVQIEGIYQKPAVVLSIPKDNKKCILYTGGISSRYGVFDLIQAFGLIQGEDYELWLCGGCEEMSLLKQYTDCDSRIKYLGSVDKDRVTELQHRATLLVNPRHSGVEFTKYSFPSKTMEYLASGTPTVMCKLPAMPADYLDHVFIFDDESIEGYAKKIMEICAMPKENLFAFGQHASKFINEQKNEVIQAAKVMELVKSDRSHF